jgi:hypothetical protein
MTEILSVLYIWLKSAHVIFVIFWMAGLFMIPRFFVYHQESAEGSEEAAKWAQEQKEKAQEERAEDESKKKDNDMDGEGRGPANQEDQRDVGYIQNAEQNTSTLWNRVKAAKGQ